MAKRILITCTDSMMKQFLEPHVINLVDNGYEVEIACSEVLNRFNEVQEDLEKIVKIHRLSLRRSPLAVPAHFKGYQELKKIIGEGHFDLIWTNEPVMGVVTRLAAQEARKNGTKVLYMVHGFHFYKGAPLMNWLFFYPIEKAMVSKTDVLCTINLEDYNRGKKMDFPRVEYIHGVGININRADLDDLKTNIRKELNIPEDAFVILSVGELNKNKNHKVIIKAIAELADSNIYYILCGKGDQRKNLERLANRLGVDKNIYFLGYRKDVMAICSKVNVFALPSKREGLGLAALEAMSQGIPVVGAATRGIMDYVHDGITGYLCKTNNVEDYITAIRKIQERVGQNDIDWLGCRRKANEYALINTKKEVLSIVKEAFRSI